MSWLRNHFWKVAVGAISFALLGWQLLTAALRERKARQQKIEEAESAVKRAKKTATDVKAVVDQETRRDREGVKEKIDANGCDLGDLFDELDAGASKRND